MNLLLLAGLLALGVLALTGRPLPMPVWVVDRIEQRANAELAGRALIAVEAVELFVDNDNVLRLRLQGLRIASATGAPIADFPELKMSLALRPLLSGKLQPSNVVLTEARITLSRDAAGNFDFALGGPVNVPELSADTPNELVEALEQALSAPIFATLERIEAERVSITYDDAVSGKTWQISDGRAALTQDADRVSLTLGFTLGGLGTVPASVEISTVSEKSGPIAKFGATVHGVSAQDLAGQVSALAWLAALDAPISGAFLAGIDAEGKPQRLDATLEIGAGALRPNEATDPVTFDSARVAFSFDPAQSRIDFSEIALDGRALRVAADGKAWLSDFNAVVPGTLVAQIRMQSFVTDPEGLFQSPVRFSEGALDLKLTLDPFVLQIGQLSLVEGGRRIGLSGRFEAGPGGWNSAADFELTEVTHERLLALWPLGLAPRVRAWFEENVTTGEMFNFTAALRDSPESEPRLSLGYEFRGAEVRVVRTLPPVRDASGYATIEANTYTLALDRGHLIAPVGGEMNVAGSTLEVRDLRIVPAPAIVTLRTESSITAALSLLDEPPFGILTRARRPVDIANGRARSVAVLNMVLAGKLRPEDIDYQVASELTDVTSDMIVAGRRVEARALALRADPGGMEIVGPGTISGVPFQISWRQDFGPEAKGRSRLDGTIELSPRALAAFNIGLPKGMLTGQGPGTIGIDIFSDAPAHFRITSELNGLRLAVPELGWSKAPERLGELEVAGTLSATPTIDNLKLKAPGLEIVGKILLQADGRMDRATFSLVDLGWFKGSAELRAARQGRAFGVAVTGGVADIRKARFGGGGGNGGGSYVQVTLDRLTVTDNLALTAFTGDFTITAGMQGEFGAEMSGGTRITGSVAPSTGGRSAFRIKSNDAGGVFRSAKIFTRGRGGALDLQLDPVGEPGNYQGQVTITDIRVRDAPVLAELLGVISVIGLLEQLGGEGILFNNVRGKFRLYPNAVELSEGRAAGASLGVTMAGVYEFATERIDMVGVISPIYFVNSLGQAVSRPGEGLIGFNYRMKGPVDDLRVEVNPLSALTPGFFRDIFKPRRPRVTE